jgi:hypothetical protein
MINEVRGERSITLGSKAYVVALTLGAQAALESAFGVENFEEAFSKIGRTEQVEGDANKVRFFPSASNLLKLWQTIIEANGEDASALAREAINPYEAATQAFDLLRTTRETWFGADTPAGTSAPLAVAPAGATG